MTTVAKIAGSIRCITDRNLMLARNQLTAIPGAVLWNTATVVDVSDNALYGSVPSSLTTDPHSAVVHALNISNNFFTGEVPLLSIYATAEFASIDMSLNCLDDDNDMYKASTFCGHQYDHYDFNQWPDADACTGSGRAPGTPIGVTAVPAVLSASVSWTQPVVRGVSVSYFTVVASTATLPNAIVVNVTASQRSALVAPLRLGVSYCFTVSAIATSGNRSTMSMPSTYVVPCGEANTTVPAPPTLVLSTAIIDGVVVAWQPAQWSKCWNGDIDAFNVSITVAGGSMAPRTFSATVPATSSSYSVPDIIRDSGVGYSFQVFHTRLAR